MRVISTVILSLMCSTALVAPFSVSYNTDPFPDDAKEIVFVCGFGFLGLVVLYTTLVDAWKR